MDIRKVTSKEDIDCFIESWEIVFQRKLDKDIYAWIFSKRNNIYCCFDGNSIVAAYCLLDIEALIDNKTHRGALCNNVYVNGFKYIKMGIFSQITEYALNDISNKGYTFALGFPNEKAIKAHLRSGWKQEHALPFYEFEIKTLSTAGGSDFRFKWLSKYESDAFRDIFQLMRRQYDKYSFSLLKDSDFIDWRFEQNPRWDFDICCIYKNNTLEGFFVSKYFLERRRVHIVDYFFNTKDVVLASLPKIYNKYIVEKGVDVDYVDAWCAAGDQYIFEQAGFLKSVDFSYVIFKDLSENNLSVGGSPHLVLADNDVF